MARNVGITDEKIIELYHNGTDYKAILEITGLTDAGIIWVLKKYNIKRTRTKRTHHFNEEFFGTWSDDMAWVLGMLITDGCIWGSQVIFSQMDKRILQEISSIMKLDYEIMKTKKGLSVLKINSKKMTEQLKTIGIFPNKSLTVSFPEVPNKHLLSFLRGVIDGDGWVHKKGYVMNVTTGSLAFAEGLYNIFKSMELKTDISTVLGGKNTAYRVWVRGKESVKVLGILLYQNCENNFVIHKKERMQYWLNYNPKSRLETKKRTMLLTKETPKTEQKESKNNAPIKEIDFYTEWYVSAISKYSVKKLKEIGKETTRPIGDLLYKGFKSLSSNPEFTLDKTKHPSDKVRIEFELSPDLMSKMRKYATGNDISFTDLMEESVFCLTDNYRSSASYMN